ncbi:MAG: hypothetical protein AUG49_19790, partial [Catenulispora sp. 13_1_20CM_3_70_7]
VFLTLMSLFDPGDEVLVPSPRWGTFTSQLTMLGARAVTVDTSRTEFLPTVEQLAAARTSRTRGVLLNTPHNPTGAVYPAELLADIADWAGRHGLWLVLDECYGDLVFAPARHVHPVQRVRDCVERVVTIGSFSKSFAVTGWRVGYLYGPRPVIDAAARFQTHLTSHAPSVLQYALVPAARGAADDFVCTTVALLEQRLALADKELADVRWLSHRRPGGAFYLFLDCSQVIGRRYGERVLDTGADLAALLLDEAGVAVVAGSAFGVDDHLRLSLTADEERLRTALARMKEVLGRVE